MAGRRSTSSRQPERVEHPVNGIARGRVAEIQRARILTAMVEVCVERGAGNVTVAHVVERAGVSRRTFYEIFDGREDCFLAAFDEAVVRASRHVLDAYDPGARWADRVRAGLTALLEFLELERGAGQLLVVESLGAGVNVLERRRRVLAQLIAAIDEGRIQARAGAEPPPLTAEGIVGGVLAVVHARLEERPGGLIGLTGPLMSMIVLPYLGPAASPKELAKPVPKTPVSGTHRPERNPLGQLKMRLTYRTVRVLLAVAANPGGSNRTVADHAGIGDQGQISKLLTRLERLGLVSNMGLGPTRGAPNAWTLTQHGEEVHSAFATQS